MQNSAFKIYNASAGSGKTYTLAKSYIKILIQGKNNDQFKSILAITFTNKAVGEMKERIINMLKLFSSETSLSKPNPMFSEICEELYISKEELHNKSKHLLKHIVHNYASFDISTIDGFTHRIVRTFAHDLKLAANFEVELDQERLLNEAVDSLIAKAGSDKSLTKVLIDFAIEKADDDKSWDISYDFNKIAKLLVSENDATSLLTLNDKSLDDFKHLKEYLAKAILVQEDTISKTANTALELIKDYGLQFSDFSGKYLPKHLEKLSLKQFNLGFDSAWQKKLIAGEALYPKRVTDATASDIERIQPQLAEAYIKTKTLYYDLKLKKGLYKNVTPLSVLNAIRNELMALMEDQNKMLISEFNKIISKEIKNQPTPFIYERLGEKFKHYFIDEFQDTSKMQWENLLPLLENALSTSNGSTMLVGDAKQAIYRWRGGEAEQFIDLYNKTANPFQVRAKVLTLDTNYRSAKEIVYFNNSFFNYLGEQYFSNSDYSNLYKSGNQHTFNEDNGYVNLSFLDIQKEDDASELYVIHVLDTIKKCQNKGFNLSDICVLVRKRKEGVVIANYLSENGIKITSSETLLLKNSNKVRFINSFLKLLLQPNNDSLKVEILTYLAEQNTITDKHQFFIAHLKLSLDDMFERLMELNIHINKNQLLQLPIYELVEQVVRLFSINKKSDAYVQFYLDVVLEFSQKQNSDLGAFVNYFEKKQDNLSVVTPESMNAVKIMTIHKSKGLEFPIVIFPFADLNIYTELEPKIWFPVDPNSSFGFETLLLNYNKDVKQFGDIGNSIYHSHQSQLELDNINLLYVVLTRAVDQLFIISKKDVNSSGVVNSKTYSSMFISYLKDYDKWSDDQLSYDFGKPLQNKKVDKKIESTESVKFISSSKEDHNLSIITNAGLLWDTKQEKAIERGNLVHLVLSKIKTHSDLGFAFNDLLVSGDIITENLQELKALVLNVIDHPKLKVYFQDDFKIYTERDIITNTGDLLRPDRLNINSKNEVIIIDYKTGDQKLFHKSQLDKYSFVLNQMNLIVTNRLLVYINDTIDVIEV